MDKVAEPQRQLVESKERISNNDPLDMDRGHSRIRRKNFLKTYASKILQRRPPGELVNLGCGDDLLPGFTNVDLYHDSADEKWDFLRTPWPKENSSLSGIHAEAVLEHVPAITRNGQDLLFLILQEMQRVLAPGGWVWIGVPMAGKLEDYRSLCHYRHFVPESFDFLNGQGGGDMLRQSGLSLKLEAKWTLRSGESYPIGYHTIKYFGVDFNIGRPWHLIFILRKPAP